MDAGLYSDISCKEIASVGNTFVVNKPARFNWMLNRANLILGASSRSIRLFQRNSSVDAGGASESANKVSCGIVVSAFCFSSGRPFS